MCVKSMRTCGVRDTKDHGRSGRTRGGGRRGEETPRLQKGNGDTRHKLYQVFIRYWGRRSDATTHGMKQNLHVNRPTTHRRTPRNNAPTVIWRTAKKSDMLRLLASVMKKIWPYSGGGGPREVIYAGINAFRVEAGKHNITLCIPERRFPLRSCFRRRLFVLD